MCGVILLFFFFLANVVVDLHVTLPVYDWHRVEFREAEFHVFVHNPQFLTEFLLVNM